MNESDKFTWGSENRKFKYIPEIQECIDFLKTGYIENEKLKYFDIFHLYPEELAYPEGYRDSKFFNLIRFNTKKMERRNLGRHDGIEFDEDFHMKPSVIRIFADGSTLIRFQGVVSVVLGQVVGLVG